MRSVVENDDDANVGDAVTADDADDDLLMYSLSGDDASSFDRETTTDRSRRRWSWTLRRRVRTW